MSRPATSFPTIRALHVLHTLERGGAETWLMDVVRHSDRSQLAMDVCLTGTRAGPYEDEFRQLGGRILRCPLDKRRPLGFYLALLRLLRASRYCVVHSHLYLFSGVVLRAAWTAGVPVRVAHIHPIEDLKRRRPFRGGYRRLMRRWIARYGSHYAAPTEAGLDAFFGPGWDLDRAKMAISNGITTGRFARQVDPAAVRRELGLPAACAIVLNVGRFAPHKRQQFLVDVAARVAERRKDVCFVMIGAGALRPKVIRLVSRRGLESRFRFIQDIADIDRFWLSADAFAFPSCNEGFGIVVAEAGAAGLPVVAQDIPGVRDAARACHDVALLPLKAGPTEWSSALARALDVGPLCYADRVERLRTFPFAIERSVEALERLYRT